MGNPSGEKKRRVLLVPTTGCIQDDFARIQWHLTDREPEDSSSTNVPSGSLGTTAEWEGYAIDWANGVEDAVEMVRQSMWDEEPYSLAVVERGGPPQWPGLALISRLWVVDPELLIATAAQVIEQDERPPAQWMSRPSRQVPLSWPLQGVEVRHLAAIGSEQRDLARLARMKRRQIEALVNQHAHRQRE